MAERVGLAGATERRPWLAWLALLFDEETRLRGETLLMATREVLRMARDMAMEGWVIESEDKKSERVEKRRRRIGFHATDAECARLTLRSQFSGSLKKSERSYFSSS